MRRIIPEKRELLKQVKAHSDKKLGDLKVENALGGMR
jgi:citrate synthase